MANNSHKRTPSMPTDQNHHHRRYHPRTSTNRNPNHHNHHLGGGTGRTTTRLNLQTAQHHRTGSGTERCNVQNKSGHRRSWMPRHRIQEIQPLHYRSNYYHPQSTTKPYPIRNIPEEELASTWTSNALWDADEHAAFAPKHADPVSATKAGLYPWTRTAPQADIPKASPTPFLLLPKGGWEPSPYSTPYAVQVATGISLGKEQRPMGPQSTGGTSRMRKSARRRRTEVGGPEPTQARGRPPKPNSQPPTKVERPHKPNTPPPTKVKKTTDAQNTTTHKGGKGDRIRSQQDTTRACRYGYECSLPECWYTHPAGRGIDKGRYKSQAAASSNEDWRLHPECENPFAGLR